MDEATIRADVLSVLKTIAPELDPAGIDPARPLRTQIDLDSMDWLNVIVGLQERFGIRIPETDYGQVVSLDGVVAYVGGRRSQGHAG